MSILDVANEGENIKTKQLYFNCKEERSETALKNKLMSFYVYKVFS